MSAQTLIFNNVELLGYTHQNNFFGENSFNYSTTKIISLQGFVLDLQNSNGVDKIFSDVNQIKLLSQNFYEIIINNQNYGVGKIRELNFDAGNWVRTTRFNATIEILENISLQNLGPSFAGLNLSNKNLNLIKNFEESFSIEFNNQNKIIGGNHKIDIEYDANQKDLNVITIAQILATELLKTLPTALSEGNYLTRSSNNYRFLHEENYDIINGKCGFNRKFSYGTNNLDKKFSIKNNISIKIGEDGIASTEETCDIKAESDNPSLYDNALVGLTQQIGSAFSRCQSLLNNYKTDFDINKNLNTTPIQKNIQINKFNGNINYTITFDNDKRKENQNYTWENTLVINRGDNWIWQASEEGTINGLGSRIGNLNSNRKYEKAELGWLNIKTGIFSRLNTFWSQNAIPKASNNLKLLNKNLSRSPYQGSITYNYTYTDDPTLRTDLGDIKRLQIQYTDDGNKGLNLAPIFQDYIIPNQNYALRQRNFDKNNQYFFEQGTFNIEITANIAISGQNQIFNGYSYFNTLKNLIVYEGGSKDKYLESISFDSNEIEQTVTLNATYKYS
jgi:hypothetical protein